MGWDHSRDWGMGCGNIQLVAQTELHRTQGSAVDRRIPFFAVVSTSLPRSHALVVGYTVVVGYNVLVG